MPAVLIANRGEIACRIIATARKLGWRIIAVYSKADRGARHVRLADEAYLLGGADAKESYLDGAKILKIARETKADFIHPGYGFLAENADFAESCADAGIGFVGPGAHAIRAMGAKDHAKAVMARAGVPIVPGYHGKGQGPKALKSHADKIGYPVLIKAVMGGGGRGMRLVERAEEFADALDAAKREAKSAFGDTRVLIEKFVLSPRHIEVQVFGDMHGNYVHLFERDCSAQRRHQKVVEEAPAFGMTPGLRATMGAAAVMAAKAVDYAGAGTVEFIVPGAAPLADDTPFFFMEMNTRLQVEHPVTELVTGLDLVDWQFKVAQGEVLPLRQDQISLDGHAIETRIYAEDPAAGFLPQTGVLLGITWPSPSPDVRLDRGVDEGDEISPYYDPMIAKLISSGSTRDDALDTMIEALAELRLAGLVTNAAFLHRLLSHKTFRDGAVDTGLIDRELDALTRPEEGHQALSIAALAWLVTGHRHTRKDPAQQGAFDRLSGWQLGGNRRETRVIMINYMRHEACFVWSGGRLAEIIIDGGDPVKIGRWRYDGRNFEADLAGGTRRCLAIVTFDGLVLSMAARHFIIQRADHGSGAALDGEAGGIITAPMPGKVQALDVAEGAHVKKGERLAVLEAMKMEHALIAPFDGTVDSLNVALGDQLGLGDVVMNLSSIGESA